MVIWRATSGQVQVWEDRCPHRGMRLSLGFVRGEALNCLYHGWEYAAAAHCVRIPAHPDLQVPKTIRAHAFLVAETGGLILTTEDENTPAPVLSDAAPVASLAVNADPWEILAFCGVTFDAGTRVHFASLNGVQVMLGWHPVSPHKTMPHITVADGSLVAEALAAARWLRDRAELRAAA